MTETPSSPADTSSDSPTPAHSGRMVVSNPLAPFEREGMVKLIAPAKVNLYLEVGGKRPDGYHEATTIMHALNLHDVIHMDHSLGGCGDGIGVEGTGPERTSIDSDVGSESNAGLTIEITTYARSKTAPLDIAAEDNIVYQAIRLLAEKVGRRETETISIRIEKHIPSEAGLGGGSSDAAAALVGVSGLWGIDADAPEVMETAQAIGADVAFFLHGGCACFTGKGDAFSHSLEPMCKNVAIVKPDQGVSTAEAYHAFDESPVLVSEEARAAAFAAKHAQEVPIQNNLTAASAALAPAITQVISCFEGFPGVEGAHMSGSGSAVFVICETFAAACQVSAEAQRHGWWARATTFGSAKAAAIPKR